MLMYPHLRSRSSWKFQRDRTCRHLLATRLPHSEFQHLIFVVRSPASSPASSTALALPATITSLNLDPIDSSLYDKHYKAPFSAFHLGKSSRFQAAHEKMAKTLCVQQIKADLFATNTGMAVITFAFPS